MGMSAIYQPKYSLHVLSAQPTPTAIVAADHTDAHIVTQSMTSPVVSRKSANREELSHFCCCLHRRRALLKKWSRRHREEAKLSVKQPDIHIASQSKLQRLNKFESLSKDHVAVQYGDPSLVNVAQIDIKRRGSKLQVDKPNALIDVCRNERLTYDERSHTNERNMLGRVDFTCSVDNVNTGGAEVDASARQLNSFTSSRSNSTTTKSHVVDPHSRVSPVARYWTGARSGRALLGPGATVYRAITTCIKLLRRRVFGGGVHGGSLSRDQWGFIPAVTKPMTFHRWLLVLLVCLMVVPPNYTVAMVAPESNVENTRAEPGYKNSFYEALPPKAMYESVIVCLLAVSAFIGLIVWVLKSNFEERQQKRMRREASIRERTSSMPFLKT